MLLRHKVSLDFGVMKHRITEKLSTYYCFKYSVTFKHSGWVSFCIVQGSCLGDILTQKNQWYFLKWCNCTTNRSSSQKQYVSFLKSATYLLASPSGHLLPAGLDKATIFDDRVKRCSALEPQNKHTALQFFKET